MTKRDTVGALALKASNDSTKYDAYEVGHALVEDDSIDKGLRDSIELHKHLTSETEFCVGYVLASDPLIKGVMRRKFFCWLYLPSPRPDQAIFLYNKDLDRITKRLWVLPNASIMERLYLLTHVPKEFITMKIWSEAFYDGHFWETIRKENNINMLSEHEYLNANREKLIEAGCKETKASVTEAFDFSQITVDEIVNS